MGNFRIIILSLVSGFVGAILAAKVNVSFLGSADAQPQIFAAKAFNLVDDSGRLRAQLAISKEGSPGLWIMDNTGVARTNLGVYPDGTAFLGFNDRKGQITQLLRSFGPDETPLHIFKINGQDMMITGLNPDAAKTPFLFFYDEKRARKVQFGKYSGP